MRKLDINSAEFKIAKGVYDLNSNHPFFGVITSRFNPTEAPFMPTTAVDMRGTLYFNREWVEAWDRDDAIFEMAHEVGHLMYKHCRRKPLGAIHHLWNVACDQIIDTTLKVSGFKQSKISLERVPVEVQKLCYRDDGQIKTSEERYWEILEEAKDNTQCQACMNIIQQAMEFKDDGNEGGTGGNSQGVGSTSEEGDPDAEDSDGRPSGGDPDGGVCGMSGGGSTVKDSNGAGGAQHTCGLGKHICVSACIDKGDALDDANMTQLIIAAAKHAQNRGKLPAAMQKFITDLKRPSVRWQDYLKYHSRKAWSDRYTFKKWSRRNEAMGVLLPGREPNVEPGVLCIDSSGSIGTEAMHQFLTEALQIMKIAGCPRIDVYFHDVVCYNVMSLSASNLDDVTVTNGGTSHIDVFRKIEERDEKPALVICFTDMMTEIPKKAHPFKIIWAYPEGQARGRKLEYGIEVPVQITESRGKGHKAA